MNCIQNMKKLFLSCGAVVVFVSVFVAVRYFSNNPYQYRLECTIISLHSIRADIALFHKRHEKYPSSITQLKEIAIDENNSQYICSKRDNKEYVSSENGNDLEVNMLDNKGGWYYNPKNGELKINLTEPLHMYFPYYFYLDRNRVPSEW